MNERFHRMKVRDAQTPFVNRKTAKQRIRQADRLIFSHPIWGFLLVFYLMPYAVLQNHHLSKVIIIFKLPYFNRFR